MILLLISSCSVKKNLDKDQYLINKYKINLEGKHPEISTSELKTLLLPQPNSKFLFMRFKVWAYYKYHKNNQNLIHGLISILAKNLQFIIKRLPKISHIR